MLSRSLGSFLASLLVVGAAIPLPACGGSDGPAALPDASVSQDYCNPASTWPPRPASIAECTAANEGAFVCTASGEGYQCTAGCWLGIIDGPCAPQPDASVGDAAVDAGP